MNKRTNTIEIHFCPDDEIGQEVPITYQRPRPVIAALVVCCVFALLVGFVAGQLLAFHSWGLLR